LLVGTLLVAAALALAGAVVPVTAFLAVPRFERVVVFLVGAAFFPASTFFGALLAAALAAAAFEALGSGFLSATFLEAAALAVATVFAFVVALLAVVDLAAVAFVVAAFTGRALGTGFGAGTLAGLFSFDADVSTGLAFLGGSLTFPAGPLGSTKMPFSAPVAMARAN